MRFIAVFGLVFLLCLMIYKIEVQKRQIEVFKQNYSLKVGAPRIANVCRSIKAGTAIIFVDLKTGKFKHRCSEKVLHNVPTNDYE